MTILWFTLVLVSITAWMARYFSVATVKGPLFISPNKFLAILAASSLVIVSGLRDNIGDTFFYKHSYLIDDFTWGTIIHGKDIGFNILQMLLKQISDDPQILIFTTALATNLLVAGVMFKYARLYELSMYLYITTGAFIVSMNGIRQFLAAAVVFAATKYIFEGCWKRYLAVVLFASVFHQSALVMIPIYFIVRRKAWTGMTFTFLALAVLIVVGFNQFSELLFSAIKDTQYGHYESFQEGGANYLRVIISAIPVVIAFFGRVNLRKIFPHGDIVVNLSILGVVLMIISTQNWIFARLSIYFSLYQLLLFGWIVKLFREKDQKFVYLTVIAFYLIYFFYENFIILDIQYLSKYLVWPL
ncbi:EpsG family protein [Bacillus sp. FJAT-28004]|uniref:EpsG family protein n=1 Tax=Bacillus sp. FJAT-28004 TaxID=1679165 RepID=UPI0006B58BB9|nr:EpsG family protein [Bacillus sp. FJAT-28004]